MFQLLLTIVTTGEEAEEGFIFKTALSKKQKSMLAFMEFDFEDGIIKHKKYTSLGQAVKYLAAKEKPLLALQYCWFDSDFAYLEKTHHKFYDQEQYQRLINWLNDNGYQRSIGFGSNLMI